MAGIASRRGAEGELLVGINVTPLVDVVLVLLVVLMVTGSYVAAQSLQLELPRAVTGEGSTAVLHVSIDKRGALEVDGRRATLAELAERAASFDAQAPAGRALIAADGATSHRQVVAVMDQLRAAGVQRVAIAVAEGRDEPR